MPRHPHLLLALPILLTASCEAPRDGRCPVGMVYIPAGAYQVGATLAVEGFDPEYVGEQDFPLDGWVDPNPAQVIEVEAFCIDAYEYPNTEGAVPFFDVSWIQAVEICQALDKRLPTSLEWSAAAQGQEGWRYAYGPEFDPEACNTAQTPESFDRYTSGAFPECRSPLGVYDLNGGLSEWVEDEWTGPWYESGGIFPAPSEGVRTLMGGTMWFSGGYGQSSLSRHRHYENESFVDDGFRCARDPLL